MNIIIKTKTQLHMDTTMEASAVIVTNCTCMNPNDQQQLEYLSSTYRWREMHQVLLQRRPQLHEKNENRAFEQPSFLPKTTSHVLNLHFSPFQKYQGVLLALGWWYFLQKHGCRPDNTTFYLVAERITKMDERFYENWKKHTQIVSAFFFFVVDFWFTISSSSESDENVFLQNGDLVILNFWCMNKSRPCNLFKDESTGAELLN